MRTITLDGPTHRRAIVKHLRSIADQIEGGATIVGDGYLMANNPRHLEGNVQLRGPSEAEWVIVGNRLAFDMTAMQEVCRQFRVEPHDVLWNRATGILKVRNSPLISMSMQHAIPELGSYIRKMVAMPSVHAVRCAQAARERAYAFAAGGTFGMNRVWGHWLDVLHRIASKGEK